MGASNIILVGFSGTGKTLVGRELARAWEWDFVDLDKEIELRAGKPVRRIFADEGEPAFRRMEKDLLQEVCAGQDKVISTGGGAMIDPENRDLILSRGLVVCLDARPDTLYARLMAEGGNPIELRPLLSSPEPLERIRTLKQEREVYYSHVHVRVPTDGLTVEQVARAVMDAWQSEALGRKLHG